MMRGMQNPLSGGPDRPTDPAMPDFPEYSCCRGLGDVDRRSFLRVMGAGTLALVGGQLPVMAGPFDNPDFDVNVPAEKKLSPDWVKALFVRGAPDVYRGDQLKTIRMPIGGVCAGHAALSGDGMISDFIVADSVIVAPGVTGSIAIRPKQGFELRTVTEGKSEVRLLNQQNFPELTFRGEYPIATVDYKNAASPVQASLEAFSPFIPLDAEQSGRPATILNFTLKNTSGAPVTATLAGGLENAICFQNRFCALAVRRNQIVRDGDTSILLCSVEATPQEPNSAPARPDIIFENWNKPTFEGWKVEGTAFGPGPIERAIIEKKMSKLGGESARLVNSYFPNQSNAGTGKLTSASFVIERNFINIWIGGGDTEGKTCVNLVVDGKVVQSQTGTQQNQLLLHLFDVRGLAGKEATLEIVDASDGYWGQIGVGRITFSDLPGNGTPLTGFPDYGTMALALLGAPAEVGMATGGLDDKPSTDASVPVSKNLAGMLGRTVDLKPGESATVTFVVAWHFPNFKLEKLGEVGRYYAKKFDSARAVAADVAANFESLAKATRLWRDVWYDSTLPYWFLDRTLVNVSTLATSACTRFADGRFYAWEGGPACCPGTCTHVWQYAHSMSRIFPELERDTRERVDLGVSLTPATGVMGFRGEYDMSLAVDGQAGTILRIYREHQMSPDNAFLKRNWDKIKVAYKPLFALDPNEEGIMDGAQANTLDRVWWGQISWMSSMYAAAARAGEQMAREIGDKDFEQRCARIAAAGFKNIPARLYNGEYFISIPDPKHMDTVNSGDGSYIDQVYGQSWAFQVGLPRVLPEKETRTALANLWKNNFSPDAGSYFIAHKQGRRFVTAGDAGLIMCTFPRKDWDYFKASGGKEHGGFAYYFNETWTGNEYQVAGHMFWENMLLEGLAIVRAIHDRYNPLERNPWSEIECGQHYSRAMASHGAFIGICGYEYHGPLGEIAFAPRLTPENFRAPFTATEGWGTYAQTLAGGKMSASLEVKYGKLRLRAVTLAPTGLPATVAVKATLGDSPIPVTSAVAGDRVKIQFSSDITIPAGQALRIELA